MQAPAGGRYAAANFAARTVAPPSGFGYNRGSIPGGPGRPPPIWARPARRIFSERRSFTPMEHNQNAQSLERLFRFLQAGVPP